MTADLPPEDLPAEFERRAAEAAQRVYTEQPNGTWFHIVKAVTAVVAPEIARPLQARVEELEAENVQLLTERLHLSNEAEALEDENLRLRDQAGEMAEELEGFEYTVAHLGADKLAAEARVRELEEKVKTLDLGLMAALLSMGLDTATANRVGEKMRALVKGGPDA